MPTLVIAHRGASGDAPENTMAAFELARTQGADMVELDVQPTSDGALAVFHDDTTRRWNGRHEAIARLTWDELSTLRIGGEPIPQLDDVCRWAQATGMRLNVELKARGVEAQVATLLHRYDLVEQTIVSSFIPATLTTLRDITPEIPRAALMGTRSMHPTIRTREMWPLWALRRLGTVAWHPAVDLPLLARLLPIVRRRGYQVNVWTVDDPGVMRRLIALGATGVISNYPARLRQVVDTTPANPDLNEAC